MPADKQAIASISAKMGKRHKAAKADGTALDIHNWADFARNESPLHALSWIIRQHARYGHPTFQNVVEALRATPPDLGYVVASTDEIERERLDKTLVEVRRGSAPQLRLTLIWYCLQQGLAKEDSQDGLHFLDEMAVALQSAPRTDGPALRLRRPSISDHPSHFSRRMSKFEGRGAALDTLHRFVSQERGFRWLQLAGAAGQGKSRMAYDLMDYVGETWECGFLNAPNLRAFQGSGSSLSATNWHLWNPQYPHLIIIDYIIGREIEIGHALGQLAERSHDFGVAVRVLLIERQRWDRGSLQLNESEGRKAIETTDGRADWFKRMQIMADDSLASEELRFEDGVIELVGLSCDDIIAMIKQRADEESLSLNFSDDYILKMLNQIDATGTPLFALLLYEALKDGQIESGWSRSDLLEHAYGEHCRKRWRKDWGERPKLEEPHIGLILALLATTIRYIDKNEVEASTGEVISPKDVQHALAFTDGPIDGGELSVGTIIPALEPDILGEWFVLNAFIKNPASVDIADLAWQTSPSAMLEFIFRIMQDFPNHSATLGLIDFEPTEENAKKVYRENSGAFVHHILFVKEEPSQNLVDNLINFADRTDDYNATLIAICLIAMRLDDASVAEAIECLRYAVSKGNHVAMMNLRRCYLDGIGVDRNEFKAAVLLVMAANAGDLDAKERAVSETQGILPIAGSLFLTGISLEDL